MKHIKRFIFLIVGLFFLIFLFVDDEEVSVDPEVLIGKSENPNQTWAIYWYLCGSDLESEFGAASTDIEELLQVKLPENIKVVIQTGGAKNWENEEINSNIIQRLEYSNKGLKVVDKKPLANMGNPNTLADFLSYTKNNYPADKKMMIIWNHGGGTVSGAAFDERYDYDSLTLNEFDEAFRKVYPLSKENPPFEVIGFDACLMATIDTAYTFSDIAKYLVASEELEPGSGWNYTGFMEKLALDPGMDGARLGQHICNSYMDGCGFLFDMDATLSVVDLSKIDQLVNAYEDLGKEALDIALNDPSFFIDLGINATFSENYGGNNKEEGYANLVDLGDFAKNCADILPKNQERIEKGLKDCVLYQRKGFFRDNACGLSCYYSYNGDPEDYYNYTNQGCSDSFKYLYGYGFIGSLDDNGMEYIGDCCDYRNKVLPHVPNILDDGYEEYPVKLNEENYAVLELDDKIKDLVRTVYMDVAYLDEPNNQIVLLGKDNDMTSDFENGVFTDNFRGVWGSIDNHLVYMEVVYENEDSTVFSVPILLNDKEYNLRVIYENDKDSFKILGARKPLDENGMADKNLVQIKAGDKIRPIFYTINLDDSEDEVKAVPQEEFIVTDKTFFEEKELENGNYLMMYELIDIKNNSKYSQMIEIVLEDENMDISILD